MLKKVSVVIPAYNASAWIAETLKSVLEQDYPNFEVIVIDDGSKDDTSGIVGHYPAVRYIHKENGGTATARNLGIREATGEYIAFVDADDLWVPTKLSKQMRLIEERCVEWVYSDAYAFDHTTGKRLYRFGDVHRGLHSGNVLEKLFIDCFIPSPTPVISRKIFKRVGLFNESNDVKNREDWEMWLRIARIYPVLCVNEPLAHYRVHATSKTGGNDPLVTLDENLVVIEKMLDIEPGRLVPVRNKAFAHAHRTTAGILISQGEFRAARVLLLKSFRLEPGSLRTIIYLGASFMGKLFVTPIISFRLWLRAK